MQYPAYTVHIPFCKFEVIPDGISAMGSMVPSNTSKMGAGAATLAHSLAVFSLTWRVLIKPA
jgi:hypothetical protein